MPRLDNSDPRVIKEFGLDCDDDDSGATEPIDLCIDCWLDGNWHKQEFNVVEHPLYAQEDYRCDLCGKRLVAWDD